VQAIGFGLQPAGPAIRRQASAPASPAQGPVDTPFAAISGMDGHFAKVFFKSSPVFRNSFNRIYQGSNWGAGPANGEGSGHGSSLEYTKNTRVGLL
jgi:hypothetical protein